MIVIWSTYFEMNLVFSSPPDFYLWSWHFKLGPRGSLQRKRVELSLMSRSLNKAFLDMIVAVSTRVVFEQLIVVHNVNRKRGSP